jgi:hypothetical protein
METPASMTGVSGGYIRRTLLYGDGGNELVIYAIIRQS